MPKTPFSIDLIGQFSLTASKSSFVREGKLFFQLRDRFGRWIDMGKSVKFKVRLKNGKYHSAIGTYSGQGHSDGVRGLITVENDAYLPNGNYPVASGNLQQYVALLSEQELKDQGIELGRDVSGNTITAREDSVIPNIDDIIGEAEQVSSPAKELRTEITGDEIQDIKISSIARALKAEGRFPVPRQSSLDTWGKTSDATKGAKLDYSKVYEGMSSEDPEFAEKYPTFNSFWDRVFDLAVDERTQSPNDLAQINQEMKEINKGYAKHVLGLDPENGTFTVYRNAINNAFEEKDAAVGYVSTSRNLAFDYNANTRVGEQANGRYEITVKPDEVNGMIGYSQVEDEYALTIGKGATYQEGRVKKVGELKTVKVAPWHEEAVAKLKRGQGATPFRGHSFVGQFDFLPISKNPLQGDTLQDFLDDNNITMDDWKNKFDELHGEGDYQRFKDSGRENQVSLQSLQKMFVDLGDGTHGLDITQLSQAGNDSAGNASYGDVQNTSSFVNDYVDNKLKFLSLIQEITGEPFMVHKNNSRNKEVVGEPEPTIEQSINISELPEGSLEEGMLKRDLRAPNRPFDEVKFDTEEFNGEEEYAVYEYQGSLYESTNKFVREHPQYKLGDKPQFESGKYYSDSVLNTVDNLDSAFKKSFIGQDLTVYRGAYVSNRNYEAILDLKEGDNINDAAYLSTSANPDVAKGFAKLLPGYDSVGEVDEEGTWIPDTSRTPVLYKINLKAGQSALKVRDHTGQTDFLNEEEVLLPRNSKIRVTRLSKSTQTVGGLNMEVLLIEAEYETESTPVAEEVSPITPDNVKELYNDTSNEPTNAKEEKIAEELYNLVLESGLTLEEISLARGDTNVDGPLGDRRKENFLNDIVELSNDWNASSQLNSIKNLQEIAKKVFGPEGVYKSESEPQWLEEYKDTPIRKIRATLLKAMYDNTQKYFADNNIKKLVVYRGLSITVDALKDMQEGEITDIIGFQGAPMASWTLDPREASYFAGTGTVLRSEIPVSSVLSMPFTGLLGTYGEEELVILGMPANTKALKYDRDKRDVSDEGLNKFRELDSNFDASKPFEPPLTQVKIVEPVNPALELTDAEEEALQWYTDFGYDDANKNLRNGEPLSDEDNESLQSLLSLIGRSSIEDPTTVYRGRAVTNPERFAQIDSLEIGDKFVDPGIMSTSYSEQQAEFYAQMNVEDVVGRFMFEIDLPVGAKALLIPDYIASYGDIDKEVLLAPNMPLEVSEIVTDDSGLKTIKLKLSDTTTPTDVIDVVNKELLRTSEDFYIEDPVDGTTKKVSFEFEQTKIAGFDEDAILVTAFYGERKLPIANLHLDSKTKMVKDITVEEDYRRKGLATELWRYAQRQGLEPKHSPLKTYEGDKWSESLGEDVGARIEPGLDNWMPILFDLLDSLEEDEEGEEITNDERGNILQSKFIEAAGFNGKPKLVTQEEFDAIDSETLFRAVSDEKFIDNYVNSETQYAGEGTSGNGTYTTNKRKTAEGFSGDTANKKELIDKRLMEIKLATDANILYLERTSDWRAWIEENKEILLEKAKQFGANPRNIQSIQSKLTSTTDWSNYAIMLGYDGFRVSAGNEEYYTIILNRGKVILNDKS